MIAELRAAWFALVDVLGREAPRTAAMIVPPRPDSARHYEKRAGVPLDPVLAEWFSLHDGSAPSGWYGEVGEVFPCRPLTSVDRAANQANLRREVERNVYAGNSAASELLRHPPASDAGEATGFWHDDFVAIAEEVGGAYLFVDQRPGPLHLCVTGFDNVDTDSMGPVWNDLPAALHAIRLAIEGRGRLRGDDLWVAGVEDGLVTWDVRR